MRGSGGAGRAPSWAVNAQVYAYNYRPMYKLSDPGVLEFWVVRVAYTAVLVEIVSQLHTNTQ